MRLELLVDAEAGSVAAKELRLLTRLVIEYASRTQAAGFGD